MHLESNKAEWWVKCSYDSIEAGSGFKDQALKVGDHLCRKEKIRNETPEEDRDSL